MEFPHSRDDGLAGIRILVEVESGVLLRQFLQGLKGLLLVSASARLHGNGYHRFIKLDMLQQNRVLRITDGVTGGGEFETYHHHDFAGTSTSASFSLICVHLKYSGNLLSLLFVGVVDLRSGSH